jgi:hypothetical protein
MADGTLAAARTDQQPQATEPSDHYGAAANEPAESPAHSDPATAAHHEPDEPAAHH